MVKDNKLSLEECNTESILKAITGNFPFGMIYQAVIKEDGTRVFTYVSDKVKQLYGCTQQEAMADSRHIYDRVYEDDREKLRRIEDEAIKSLTPFECEVRMIDPSGQIRWSHFVSTPKRLSDGSICWNGFELDITEHKKIEAALKASENLVKSVANNLASGMIYQLIRNKDGSRRFTYLSESVERLYGVSSMAAMEDASLIYDKIHEDDRQRLYIEEEKANETLSVFRTEARIIGPSGEIRWSCFVSHPTLLDDGVTRWDGIQLDITDLKKAEELIKRSENYFRAIFENSRDAIFIADVETGALLDANEMALQLVERPRSDIIGKHHTMLHPADKKANYNDQFSRHVAKNHADPEPSEVITSSGRRVPVEISASTTTLQDGRKVIIGNFRDVTERKKFEDALKAKIQEMEKFQDITMGREDRIIELKEEAKKLKAEIEKLKAAKVK